MAFGQQRAVNGNDPVATAQSGLFCGAVIQRCHDPQRPIGQLLQLHTNAIVGATGLFVEVFGVGLFHVGAVWIKIQQQAAHRRLHQLVVIHRVHIGLLDRVIDGDITPNFVQRHFCSGSGHRIRVFVLRLCRLRGVRRGLVLRPSPYRLQCKQDQKWKWKKFDAHACSQ